MASAAKRRIKRVIIAAETPCFVLSVLGYPVSAALLIWAAPTITTTQLAVLSLFIGFTSALGAWASALKTADTEE